MQIEVEEILEFTSEGEESSMEEEPPLVQSKHLTLAELKKKQSFRPFGGSASRNLSQVISLKKKTHCEEEFKFLGIGKNMSPAKSQRINHVGEGNSGAIKEESVEMTLR